MQRTRKERIMTNGQCERAMGDDGRDGAMLCLLEEVRKTPSLAYLWHHDKPKKFTTTKPLRAETHGSAAKDGSLIKCLVGSVELPVGTEGYVFTSEKQHYSEYVWVGDEQYPKAGARIISTGRYFTFVAWVEVGHGHEVLATVFHSVDWPARDVGTV
jgi:hypothetical protein